VVGAVSVSTRQVLDRGEAVAVSVLQKPVPIPAVAAEEAVSA